MLVHCADTLMGFFPHIRAANEEAQIEKLEQFCWFERAGVLHSAQVDTHVGLVNSWDQSPTASAVIIVFGAEMRT